MTGEEGIKFNGENMDSFISNFDSFRKDLENVSSALTNISRRLELTPDWKDFGKDEMNAYMKLIAIYAEMLSGKRDPDGTQFNDYAKMSQMDEGSHIEQFIKTLKEYKESMDSLVKISSNRDECFSWLDSAQ